MELFPNSSKYPDQINNNLELIKGMESPKITVEDMLNTQGHLYYNSYGDTRDILKPRKFGYQGH